MRSLFLLLLAACGSAAPGVTRPGVATGVAAAKASPPAVALVPWKLPCRVPVHLVTHEFFFDQHEELDYVLETRQEGEKVRFHTDGQELDVLLGPEGALEVAPGEAGERAAENFRTLVEVWREPGPAGERVERQSFFSSEGVHPVTARREGDPLHRKIRFTIEDRAALLEIDWFRGILEENANRIAADDQRRSADQAFGGGDVWVEYEAHFDHGRPTRAVWSRGFRFVVDGGGDSGTWEQWESTLDWARAEGCGPL